MIARLYCFFRGHDYRNAFEGARMYLRCADCGHETQGWEIRKESDNPRGGDKMRD